MIYIDRFRVSLIIEDLFTENFSQDHERGGTPSPKIFFKTYTKSLTNPAVFMSLGLAVALATWYNIALDFKNLL